MRKPAVVVIIVLTLLLLLTLARRLAQPAIASDISEPGTQSSIVKAAPVHPLPALPAPIRPTVGAAVTNESSGLSQPEQSMKSVTARKQLSRVKSAKVKTEVASSRPAETAEAAPAARPSGYRALLGEPSSRIRRVVDHGAHGIGTPQWIEPLSGPKTRVPVRDFSSDRALTRDPEVAPLAVPVDSNPRAAAESAH